MPPTEDRARMEKAELRRRLRRSRSERTDGENMAAARRLAALAPQVDAYCAGTGSIAGFLPSPNEPPVEPLLISLREAGRPVLLPVVSGDSLDWVWFTPEAPVATHPTLRIPEPVGPVVGHGADGLVALGCSLLLIPALAVTPDGRRLGQGGGFYDRLFDRWPNGDLPPVMAVVWEDEVIDDLPVESHDHPVGAVITPRGVRRTR